MARTSSLRVQLVRSRLHLPSLAQAALTHMSSLTILVNTKRPTLQRRMEMRGSQTRTSTQSLQVEPVGLGTSCSPMLRWKDLRLKIFMMRHECHVPSTRSRSLNMYTGIIHNSAAIQGRRSASMAAISTEHGSSAVLVTQSYSTTQGRSILPRVDFIR